MTSPRLSIGLPVYNGAQYLPSSLDALLGQTYGNFELIVSDNASTDDTEEICRRYCAMDDRIRYLRQLRNIGAAPNHNLLLAHARGELFKWASHDDLYGRHLLADCVAALDERPDIIVAHSLQAIIDQTDNVRCTVDYPHRTDSPRPSVRLRSILFEPSGDDFYGVFRTDLLRRAKPLGSHYHSDRTFVAELALLGRFHQVRQIQYFRRDHQDRALRANPTVRAWCANLDPRRTSRMHPTARLLAECALEFLSAIARVPMAPAERRACYRDLAHWWVVRNRLYDGEPGWRPVGAAELSDLVARTVAGHRGAPG